MSYTVFADESGVASGYKCYGIGALIVPNEEFDGFLSEYERLRALHPFPGEVKWKKIMNNRSQMNFAIDLLKLVLRSSYRFGLIVVNKSLFRNWHALGPERAFYQTYVYLLQHIANRGSGDFKVHIDHRDDSYDKQNEVVEKITNYMLARLRATGRLYDVTKDQSKLVPGIQCADIITGAITAAHNRYLDPGMDLNDAKKLLISRLAEVIGWDDLIYDTYPATKFNIWHFPTEYRSTPRSRNCTINFDVPYISAGEM